jgi:hypothetical protein
MRKKWTEKAACVGKHKNAYEFLIRGKSMISFGICRHGCDNSIIKKR